MLKLSRMTDYAMLILACMAQQPELTYNASQLAKQTKLSQSTVSKLLKTLANHGLLQSFRGAYGGYRLIRAPVDIPVLKIITVLEGPIAVTECNEANHSCSLEAYCPMSEPWHQINDVINKALEDLTLADISKCKTPMPLTLKVENE